MSARFIAPNEVKNARPTRASIAKNAVLFLRRKSDCEISRQQPTSLIIRAAITMNADMIKPAVAAFENPKETAGVSYAIYHACARVRVRKREKERGEKKRKREVGLRGQLCETS